MFEGSVRSSFGSLRRRSRGLGGQGSEGLPRASVCLKAPRVQAAGVGSSRGASRRGFSEGLPMASVCVCVRLGGSARSSFGGRFVGRGSEAPHAEAATVRAGGTKLGGSGCRGWDGLG